jgi:hypothetical protein
MALLAYSMLIMPCFYKEGSMETKITIYAAFIAAQAEFGSAVKASTNPHFKSRYADLSSVLEAVLPALNKHGLGLTYRVHDCDNGVRLEAVVIHLSGEELSSGILHVPVAKNDAQAMGSALSYGKRYLASGLFSLQTSEDDDGNAASASVKPTAISKPTRYDISGMEGTVMLNAEKFLGFNGAKHLGDGVWESPIKLVRLSAFEK